MLYQKLFPQLSGRWGYINLNSFFKLARHLSDPDYDSTAIRAAIAQPNRFATDLGFVQKTFALVNESFGFDYRYGGYLEDRNDVWEDTYLPEGGRIHLGVDYEVPEGTEVHCPVKMLVLHSWADPDMNGGWGGRLILRTTVSDQPDKFVILGHLKKDTLPPVDSTILKGEVLGRVGGVVENGGWAIPHLHVQMISKESLVKHKDAGTIELIDGYSPLYKNIEFDYPNPEMFLLSGTT